MTGRHGGCAIRRRIGTYQRPSNPMIVIATDFDAMLNISCELMVTPEPVAALRRTRNGVIVGVTNASSTVGRSEIEIPIRGIVPKGDGSTDWQFDIVGTYTLQQPDWATRILANYDFVNEALSHRQEPVGCCSTSASTIRRNPPRFPGYR